MGIGKKWNKSIIIGFFMLSFLALFIRCFFSFDWTDESFYIASTNRFYQGDRLVADDWMPTQLSALLTLPIISLHRLLGGVGEGIVLFFRICYLVFSFAISILIYKVFSEIQNYKPAIICSMLYLFYVKHGIGSFSYNTLANSFLILTALLICRCIYRCEFKIYQLLLIGFCYSIAVMCIPHLAVLYLVGIACFLFVHFIKKTSQQYTYFHILRGITIGIIFTALSFLLYMFQKISFSEFLHNLPYLFQEPEYVKDHNGIVLFMKLIYEVCIQYKFTIIIYSAIIFYFLFGMLRKKKMNFKEKRIIWTLQIILLIINIVSNKQQYNIGICFICFSMFGLAVILTMKTKVSFYSLFLYITGIFISIIYYFASDTGIYAVAAGCMFSAIGTVLMLYEVIEKNNIAFYRMQIFATKISVLFVLLVTVHYRLFDVYRDGNIFELTYQIEKGPAKGLMTCEENYYKYNDIYNAIIENVSENDKVFFTKLLPWGYLCTSAECAATTTWRTPLSSERLIDYYRLKPDKIPTVIFVVDKEYGYTNEQEILQSVLLKEYFEEGKAVSGAVIYKRKE